MADLFRRVIGGSLDELESESYSVSSGVSKLRTGTFEVLFLVLAFWRGFGGSFASSNDFVLTNA